MLAIVKPGNITGTIAIPPSKSMMQRVCACALLHQGKTFVHNTGSADDDKAALQIIQDLGATISYAENNCLEIDSTGLGHQPDSIDCGESGLSARLFLPIAALLDRPITVTGSGSLLYRPMAVHRETLPQLGVTIHSHGDHLPITLQGPLQPKDITVDGSLSSQFLSGLLITYTYAATEPCTITVSNLTSKPYIDMTLQVLQYFGKEVTHEGYERFHITPTEAEENIYINIESDWSSATAFCVAGGIAGSVTLSGLNQQSLQADRAILDIVKTCGAKVSDGAEGLTISKAEQLTAFTYDATDSPDLFPLLSVLAACCVGESKITGIHRLEHKESNRLRSISELLTKLGVAHHTNEDSLLIEGKEELTTATINSQNDHRIAMAAAIAALKTKEGIHITHANAVNKSYPDFFAHLSSIGADCQLKETVHE